MCIYWDTSIAALLRTKIKLVKMDWYIIHSIYMYLVPVLTDLNDHVFQADAASMLKQLQQ